MSVSRPDDATETGSRGRYTRSAHQHAAGVLHWAIGTAGFGFVLLLSFRHDADWASSASQLIPWVAAMAVANLVPVSGWYSTSLAPDLPIAVAAAMILTPAQTGLVAFLGAFDPKELRGQIPARKAMFNRAQVALADMAGSMVAHSILGRPNTSALILPVAFAVLGTILAVNLAMVTTLLCLEHDIRPSEVFRRLHPGAPVDLLLTFTAWAVLGAMVVALYERVHVWALLAFLAPTLLGRQVLARSQMFLDAARAYESREQAIVEIGRQIQDERSDERRLIAADLHDEVLQPLFKVSLMAHVIKADMATGRLLELDADLPELLSAAEIASGSLRELIGDLRKSTLGRGGLDRALTSLVNALKNQTGTHIRDRIEPVEVTPQTELVIYQIAKEALTNALAHSGAREISVSLSGSESGVVLAVCDDGRGFLASNPREGHYGLHIMKERAAAIGAGVYIDSHPGEGCLVRLVVP